MLEAAPVVDDHDLSASAAQRRAHFLQQHRLPRAGFAADRDIVVASIVLEWRPEEGLAAPAHEQQVRMDAAEILALHGSDIGRCRREHGLEALEALHVRAKPIGQRHRHGREQPLDLQVSLIGKIPARRLVDRLDRAFVAVPAAERGVGRQTIEDPHQTSAFLQLGLHMLPLGRLLADAGQEARTARSGKARRAHELEAGLGRSSFLVGIDEAQHRRGRAGEAQLVGEHVADKPRAFPRRPALGHVARGKMPHVEGIGVDRADLGNAVLDLARRTKPLGDEPHTVFVDDELDIVPDRLGRDRVVRIIGHGIVLRRGGRRGQVVDDRDQLLGLDFGNAQIERFQHGNKAVAGLLEIFVADRLGRRHADRNDDLMVPGVEGRILRARFPDKAVEPPCAVTGNRLVDAALDIARRKPGCDDPADARGCEMQDLETGACRKPFGEE
ncbi:hypothetical protein NSU_0107 [Novosphingobium pentaromativorans US6-1]|uniref:Uncharacterized protein n=1 Tax=Novosphingobium pentaromativorans US6-1 TaxID=1088721 RepID=G6E6Y6_9SPHN|nr:hypothetical protein NSU_0107 [Novosphingobium pentaromativorans US6-1]